MYKNAISLLLCLIAGVCMADIPGYEKYTELGLKEFENYFAYEYSEAQGGELFIGFSDGFLKQFNDQGCLVSVTLGVFNKEGDLVKWAQGGVMHLVNLPVSNLSGQKLYVGGLGDRVVVKLLYYSKNCGSQNTESEIKRVLFDFKSLRESIK